MLQKNKSIMFYEPRLGHGLPHDPFKAIVAPRPIGWISTVDEQGRHNLAPYSFFNAISSKPPMVAFSSEGMKDSVRNAMATREFVCNLATAALADGLRSRIHQRNVALRLQMPAKALEQLLDQTGFY